VREYSFSDIAILNAQLQVLISLDDYAERTEDAEARAFARALERAAMALLARFDIGCWSRYALDGGAASPAYHAYHVALLERLAAATGDPLWSKTAARWKRCPRAE
jgi:hypothetical protein